MDALLPETNFGSSLSELLPTECAALKAGFSFGARLPYYSSEKKDPTVLFRAVGSLMMFFSLLPVSGSSLQPDGFKCFAAA